MNFSNLFLMGKSNGRRVLYWPGLCYRIILHSLGAAALFLLAYCAWFVLTGSRFMGILEAWGDNSLLINLKLSLLVFVGIVLTLTVAVPLIWPLFLPLDRLPERGALAKPSRLGRLALFGLACLITLVALYYLEEDWCGKRAWVKYQRQLVAQGERLELSAFVPPPVPAAENFALTPLLAPLFDFKPGTHEWRDPSGRLQLENFATQYWAASQLFTSQPSKRVNTWMTPGTDILKTWYSAFLQATNPAAKGKPLLVLTNITYQQAAAGVLAGLSECNPLIEELRSASRRPYARFNINYDEEFPSAILLPHLAPLKGFCQVLRLRASAELALDRTAAAFDDLRLIFDLADAIRNEPFAISHLVRIAALTLGCGPLAEGLAKHQWTDTQLRAFQERLGRLDLCAEAKHVLAAERVFLGIIQIDRFRRASNRAALINQLDILSGSQQATNIKDCAGIVPTGWYYFEQVNFNRVFQDYMLPAIDVAQRQISPAATRKLTEQLEAGPGKSELRWFFRHELFIHGSVRDLRGLPERVAYTQTGMDAAALACALERYHLANGQFPESLDVLVPKYIEKVPHDIINGQPLKYHRTQDKQFLLYSVGWNETDDGGIAGGVETGDWVWRYPEN